jgi:hypothetical protein
MIAGERDGWDYVWPRDAAAGVIALEAAGLQSEARRVAGFLANLDLDAGARFYPDGTGVPGRPPAGDGEGWVKAATEVTDASRPWRDRQDYGENVSGDLLGNAIAAGAPASEIEGRFATARGLVREQGTDELDSSAAWAATVFPSRGLAGAVTTTLLELTRESTPYGIPPMQGWTPGEVWTAPTAWSAWALVELGETRAADRLLAELRLAETPQGTLPERADATTGAPTSTTPLAWSHAFAILALRARYRDKNPWGPPRYPAGSTTGAVRARSSAKPTTSEPSTPNIGGFPRQGGNQCARSPSMSMETPQAWPRCRRRSRDPGRS